MTAKRNDGRRLEELVAMIEGVRLPPGFKMERRDRIYNDAGQQIAELDILISGQIGSVKYQTLFECRDRPSEGAAPAAWIEQLDGRRRRLGIDIIVAVSTTGFAPDAERYAKQANIPLRSVESLTEDAIRGFLPKTAPILHHEWNLLQFHFVVTDLDPTVIASNGKSDLKTSSFAYSSKDKNFLNRSTGAYHTARQVCAQLISDSDAGLFDDVLIGGAGIEKTVKAKQKTLDAYRFVKDDQSLYIAELTVTLNLRQYWSDMPLVFAANYGEIADPSATVAEWEGGSESAIKKMAVVVHKIPDKN